jgi:hypothetical protein
VLNLRKFNKLEGNFFQKDLEEEDIQYEQDRAERELYTRNSRPSRSPRSTAQGTMSRNLSRNARLNKLKPRMQAFNNFEEEKMDSDDYRPEDFINLE